MQHNNPRIVAIGTAGAANALATTATRLIRPSQAASSGVTANCAAKGTATAMANQLGQPRARHAAVHRPANRTNPSVAATDSANPRSEANSGANGSKTTTAAATDGTAAPRRPHPIAINPTAAITEARRTLGSGRAKTANATIVAHPTTVRPRGPTPRAPANNRTAPHYDGDVRPGHRHQVAHARSPEILGDLLRSIRHIPHDQPRQQTCGPWRQSGASRPERLSHGTGNVLPPRWRRLGDGGMPTPHGDRSEVSGPVLDRGHPAGHGHALPGQQTSPFCRFR